MHPLQARDIISISLAERAELILERAASVEVPLHMDVNLQLAYQISTVLMPTLADFVRHQIREDRDRGSVLERDNQSRAIGRACREFSNRFITDMPDLVRTPAEMASHPRNLYELCGAAIFAQSNSISRTLSTVMGELWETIAKISPYVLSPERDLGLKITGVDAIVCPHGDGLPTFVQIKTQRNTLTGSQAPRSIRELELYPQRLFAAAFCTGGGWTFASRDIPRVCGADFWAIVGIDFDELKLNVKRMVLDIESAYIELQKKSI